MNRAMINVPPNYWTFHSLPYHPAPWPRPWAPGCVSHNGDVKGWSGGWKHFNSLVKMLPPASPHILPDKRLEVGVGTELFARHQQSCD